MRTSRWLAVAAGLVIAVSAATVALPALADDSTGTVTGHFTDGSTPLSVTVTLQSGDGSFVVSTPTDENGGYTFTDVPAGTYTVNFAFQNGPVQYAFGQLDPNLATPITVTAGQTSTVDDTLVPHGGLRGHVTRADGAPAAFASVSAANDTDHIGFGSTAADANGDYSMSVLTPGNYTVSFQADLNSPLQYANQKTNLDDADRIPVTAGAVTVLDQQMLATGTLSGTLTDHGQPVEGAFVSANAADGTGVSGTTGSDGAYQLNLLPGTYAVQFQLPNGLTQYAHERIDPARADPITITAGAVTVDNEKVAPTGVVSGHLVDQAGNPVAGASVELSNDIQEALSTTDESGAYQMTAFTGTYRLSFGTPFGVQWAHRRATAGQADPVVVTADTTTTVDEALVPNGSVTVTAVDSQTHHSVPAFCVNLEGVGEPVCTTNGAVHFPTVLPGRYFADITNPEESDTFVPVRLRGVVVTSGADTAVKQILDKRPTVSALITDAKTGAPVAQACLELVGVSRPETLGNGGAVCSDATGHVTIPFESPGQYKAFVRARDDVHGSQWVGPNGGVGAFKQARTVTLMAGASITLPTIKLDKAGSISGVVTDAASGQPVPFSTIGLASFIFGAGFGTDAVAADKQGRYTLSGLGPYGWTLFISASGEASVFSGGVADRDKATPVKVKAGSTTTFNVAMRPGVTVTGNVFGLDGTALAASARVSFINADSGEVMGDGDAVGGVYTAHIAPSEKVKIGYNGSAKGDNYSGFVAGVINIPGSGTKTINVTMSQLDP
jgi:protocatechuate 3,4-dioxygenase beta subunit